MKAAVYTRYGPPEVVHIQDVDKPVPKANEVLIRIHATTVSSADWRLRSLSFPPGFGIIGRLLFGIFRPRKRILGTELSGVIESVGSDVKRFKIGDKVFADCSAKLGGHAEYQTLEENAAIALIPTNLDFGEAAALSFGGTVALDFLNKLGNLQPGERVLINGASGTTGTALVQLAKHIGAEVTGVCSTSNVELVKSLGVDHVIDYKQEDFAQNGETYDMIVDTAGTATWARSKSSLSETGRLMVVLGSMSNMLLAGFRSQKHGRKVINGVANPTPETAQSLADLAEAGHFMPVIDRTYPFDEIVEAHAYVDSGRKKGSVVISIVP